MIFVAEIYAHLSLLPPVRVVSAVGSWQGWQEHNTRSKIGYLRAMEADIDDCEDDSLPRCG